MIFLIIGGMAAVGFISILIYSLCKAASDEDIEMGIKSHLENIEIKAGDNNDNS